MGAILVIDLPSERAGTHFLASFDARLVTCTTTGGHVLLRPVVNRQHIGWMLLDSGVSGMSIDSTAARQLKLKPHGKIRVQTMDGSVDSCLFQVKRFELGTLVMHGYECPSCIPYTFRVFAIAGWEMSYQSNVVGQVRHDHMQMRVHEATTEIRQGDQPSPWHQTCRDDWLRCADASFVGDPRCS